MANILVTGGAGFIGSNFILYKLKNSNDKIVCVDCLTYAGNIENLTEANSYDNYVFYKGDIRNQNRIQRIVQKENIDTIINFAAESHVDRSINNLYPFLSTNITGTAALLEVSRRKNITRFHQIGTDEVYGDLPLDRPDLFFTETTNLHPNSPYSVSKAAADMLTLSYYRTYGLPVTISRCSNNYGPYQFPQKLIPLMIINALQNKPLPVYGTGENIRDWLYVEDHCIAIDKIVQQGEIGEIYNIGGHNQIKNIDIVKTICKKVNAPESLITYVEDRKGHDKRYAINPSKMRKFGWYPKTDFENGLNKTIDWYINNKQWWVPLYENINNRRERTSWA